METCVLPQQDKSDYIISAINFLAIYMFKDDMQLLSGKIAENALEDAEILVKKMHETYNDQALKHVRIHFAWAYILSLKKDYLSALGNIFVGFFFAIPVSLFKQYQSH